MISRVLILGELLRSRLELLRLRMSKTGLRTVLREGRNYQEEQTSDKAKKTAYVSPGTFPNDFSQILFYFICLRCYYFNVESQCCLVRGEDAITIFDERKRSHQKAASAKITEIICAKMPRLHT